MFVKHIFILLRPHPLGIVEDAAVDVERTPDAVSVEDIHKAVILKLAVVIAHGQRLVPASGKAAVDFQFCCQLMNLLVKEE